VGERTEPIRVTDETFEREVIRSSIPVVVDFYADWCAPCRVAEPLLRDLSAQLAGRVKVAKVNVDEAALVTRSYGIHMLPTYVFVQAGQEKGREVGSVDLVAFREGVRKYFSKARVSGGRRASR
jgi:thioredoxin 1